MEHSAVTLPESLRSGSGPLVSVILPTYGDSEFIDGALESIANQTHTNVEIIVVDSSGVDWLSELASRTEGFEYVYQEPSGLAAARNRGIDRATGDLIAFLDADDRWLPEKLEKQLAAIESGADLVYSDNFIEDRGRRHRMHALPITKPETVHLEFLRNGGVPILTVMARRECFDAERFDESLAAVEDRDLLVRLFREFRVAHIGEPLAVYRRRSDSLSSDPQLMVESERASIQKLTERFPEIVPLREELERRARYVYGKRLLRTGQEDEARGIFRDLLADGQRDPKTVSLAGISHLPFGHQYMLRTLERIEERIP